MAAGTGDERAGGRLGGQAGRQVGPGRCSERWAQCSGQRSRQARRPLPGLPATRPLTHRMKAGCIPNRPNRIDRPPIVDGSRKVALRASRQSAGCKPEWAAASWRPWRPGGGLRPARAGQLAGYAQPEAVWHRAGRRGTGQARPRQEEQPKGGSPMAAAQSGTGGSTQGS